MASYSVVYGGYLYASGVAADTYSSIDCSASGATADPYSVDFRLADGVTATMSKLTAHVSTNTQSTDTIITLEVDGVATDVTITIPAGETGWFATTTESAAFVSGDKLVYHTERGDGGDIVVDSITMLLTKDGENTATWLLGCTLFFTIAETYEGEGIFAVEQRAVGTDSTSNYGDDEYQFRYNVRTAATAKYLQCYVKTNTRDEDAIYKVYKNGVATDIAITLTAGQTGWFVDTTHTASFAVGDKLSYGLISEAAATTGEIDVDAIHLMMESGSTSQDIVTGGNDAPVMYDGVGDTPVLGASPSGYLAIQSFDPDVPETSKYAIKFPIAGTLSKLSFTYTNYGVIAGVTDQPFYARPMIAGSAGTQLIEVDTPVTPDESGVVTDATNTDAVVAGNEYYVEFGLSDLASATNAWGCEVDLWSISTSFTPVSAADEFGCTKSCEGSETYYSLVNKTLKMLGEDPDAPVYWTSAEIGRYVNDAYGDMASSTKALEFIEAIALTPDSGTGTMSEYVLQPFRVTFDDYKVIATTKYELDRGQTDWESLSGYVDRYVTGLNDQRTLTTYKAWDGTSYYAREFFFNDGAYTYTAWANATAYSIGDRVTITDADGIVTGYYCYSAHTSATATNKPVTGSAWTDRWYPLALMVWATKTPADLATCDEPEFPCWSHISIAYKAAAKALRKYGEQKNDALADVYDQIGESYWEMLRSQMANRAPERTLVMGGRSPRRGIRPYPWPPAVEV